jgi:hypothetical protein
MYMSIWRHFLAWVWEAPGQEELMFKSEQATEYGVRIAGASEHLHVVVNDAG